MGVVVSPALDEAQAAAVAFDTRRIAESRRVEQRRLSKQGAVGEGMANASISKAHELSAASATAPIRVAVLGGQPLLRDSLRALIERQQGMEVLSGEAIEALLKGSDSPHVVVVDADDGDERAHGLLETIRASWPHARIVLVPTCCEPARAREFLLAGASGVVTKDRPAAQLAMAIRKVSAGEVWLERTSLSTLIADLSREANGASELENADAAALTAREVEVVELVARGCSNKAIATRLGISDHTVRHHLTSIFSKLGVSDRLALAVHALRNGVKRNVERE